MRTWREKARPVIAAIIERMGLEDEKATRKAISEAYPFGMRQYHPYKTWCSEVKRQIEARRKWDALGPGGQALFRNIMEAEEKALLYGTAGGLFEGQL